MHLASSIFSEQNYVDEKVVKVILAWGFQA